MSSHKIKSNSDLRLKTPIAQGQPVPPELLEPLHDSAKAFKDNDEASLRQQLNNDGYVHLKNFFSADETLGARAAIFSRLNEVGEINKPVEQGVYSGTSHRAEAVKDLGEFWRAVSEQWALRRLSHGSKLHALNAMLFDEPTAVQDFVFLRPVNPGKFTHIHCDAPFFTRRTNRVLTTWIALSDVPYELGPLFIVNGSHQFDDIVQDHLDFDVVRDKDRKAAFTETPIELARTRATTLLSDSISAGDIIVFGMYTLHGTFDNVATDNRCRLSCDVRYQPLREPMDERYFSADPGGTTGGGYGELVGAKPLSDAWHIR